MIRTKSDPLGHLQLCGVPSFFRLKAFFTIQNTQGFLSAFYFLSCPLPGLMNLVSPPQYGVPSFVAVCFFVAKRRSANVLQLILVDERAWGA